MKTKMTLQIACDSQETARLLAEATGPDNHPLPENLQLEASTIKNQYTVTINHSGSIRTLCATIDDLLRSLSLVLSITDENEQREEETELDI